MEGPMEHLRVEKVKKCRRKWACHECLQTVNKGESIEKNIVATEGSIFTHVTCRSCLAFVDTLSRDDRSDFYYTDECILADHPGFDEFMAEWVLLDR